MYVSAHIHIKTKFVSYIVYCLRSKVFLCLFCIIISLNKMSNETFMIDLLEKRERDC